MDQKRVNPNCALFSECLTFHFSIWCSEPGLTGEVDHP